MCAVVKRNGVRRKRRVRSDREGEREKVRERKMGVICDCFFFLLLWRMQLCLHSPSYNNHTVLWQYRSSHWTVFRVIKIYNRWYKTEPCLLLCYRLKIVFTSWIFTSVGIDIQKKYLYYLLFCLYVWMYHWFNVRSYFTVKCVWLWLRTAVKPPCLLSFSRDPDGKGGGWSGWIKKNHRRVVVGCKVGQATRRSTHTRLRLCTWTCTLARA